LQQRAPNDARSGRPHHPNGSNSGRRHAPSQPSTQGPGHPRTQGAPNAAARPHHKSSKPGFRPHAKAPHHQGAAPSSGNGQGHLSGPPQRQPQRPRNNFDEIQPQSNANASPFSTPRNQSGNAPH